MIGDWSLFNFTQKMSNSCRHKLYVVALLTVPASRSQLFVFVVCNTEQQRTGMSRTASVRGWRWFSSDRYWSERRPRSTAAVYSAAPSWASSQWSVSGSVLNWSISLFVVNYCVSVVVSHPCASGRVDTDWLDRSHSVFNPLTPTVAIWVQLQSILCQSGFSPDL